MKSCSVNWQHHTNSKTLGLSGATRQFLNDAKMAYTPDRDIFMCLVNGKFLNSFVCALRKVFFSYLLYNHYVVIVESLFSLHSCLCCTLRSALKSNAQNVYHSYQSNHRTATS